MNKYIRTKDKIYLIQKDISYGGNKIYKIYNHDFSIKGNNCKVADTIEELCDCFSGEFVNGEKVILEKWNGNKFVIRWETNMISMIKDLNKTYTNVYGCIWTNKGLIYVAKMDNNGKLVLI